MCQGFLVRGELETPPRTIVCLFLEACFVESCRIEAWQTYALLTENSPLFLTTAEQEEALTLVDFVNVSRLLLQTEPTGDEPPVAPGLDPQ
ncbi:hypothetical protein Krac_11431 [Ktedonobacter racemifer DSM 44963]|uniref:Uncharacterized protein n=1 Tax=Ktedonobacter racemifer DSM 44963 TaxID=485913 RepID=D6TBR7_KTERA|nr:hypothetical protein Krac_11431 [Ktedonobacter racemifer DSM 44963]